MRFIYVMSETDRDKLVELGYFLIREDTRNMVWVFKSKDSMSFSSEHELEQANVRFVLSDTLMF